MISKQDVVENMLVFIDAMLRGFDNYIINLALDNGWIPDPKMVKCSETEIECYASKFLYDNDIETD